MPSEAAQAPVTRPQGPARLRWSRLRRVVATRHYGSRTGGPAVSRIEVALPDGELHAGSLVICTGPTGSGKTTLLSALALADLEFQGTVEVLPDGRPLSFTDARSASPWTLAAARRRLGLVFQDDRLLEDRTALDNVTMSLEARALGSWGSRRAAAVAALEQVGLPARDHTRRVSEFSGGMKRRTALARAIAGQPLVLLCDEPSQGLDPVNAREIWELLRRLASGGLAVLAVTHDRAAREFADDEIHLSATAVDEVLPAPASITPPPALRPSSFAVALLDVLLGGWALLWPRARLLGRLTHLGSVLLAPGLAALLLVLSFGLTRALHDFIHDVEQRFPSPRRLAITSTGGADAQRHMPSLATLKALDGVSDVQPRWFYSATLLEAEDVDSWDQNHAPPPDDQLEDRTTFEIGHVGDPDADGQWFEWGAGVPHFSSGSAPEALVQETALERLDRDRDIVGQDLYFAVRRARQPDAPPVCARVHVIGIIPARAEPEVRPVGEVVIPTRVAATLVDFGMNHIKSLPSGLNCFAEKAPAKLSGLIDQPHDPPDYVHVYAKRVDQVGGIATKIRNLGLTSGEGAIPYVVETNDEALVQAQAFLRWGSWAAWLVGAIPACLAGIAMFMLTSFVVFSRRSMVLLDLVQGASRWAESGRVVVFAGTAAAIGSAVGIAAGVSFGKAMSARTQDVLGWGLIKVPPLVSHETMWMLAALVAGSSLAALLGAAFAGSGNPATVFRGGA